jgi:beta-N-acetylhexosaminidase
VLDGLRAGGVVGIVKHIPGHGRARADSHLELPVVDAPADALERDFAPFRRLADAPMAMTAHISYTALDAQRCATLSPTIIDIIRRDIGFGGLLMSDDLGMQALGNPASGGHPPGSNALFSMTARALACLEAGCDVALHCSGDFAEMEPFDQLPPISPAARARLDAAMAWAAPGAAGGAAAGPGADARPAAHWAAARDALLAIG